MSPAAPSTGPRAAETKDVQQVNEKARNKAKLKKVLDNLKLAENYKNGFDSYIGDEGYDLDVKKEMTPRSIREDVEDIVKTIQGSTKASIRKTKDFRHFINHLKFDLIGMILKNKNDINKNIPLTIALGPGSKLFFHNKKGYEKTIDLKSSSPIVKIYERQKRDLKTLLDKKKKGKESVRQSASTRRETVRQGVKPESNFNLLANKSKSQYLKKKPGGIYVVDFKKGKRIDRRAEKATQIQDLLDLSRLSGGNMYIRIHLDGVSPGGIKHKYFAYYHPSQKTFIREGTTKRALIFHGTKISKIDYRVSNPKKAAAPKIVPRKQKVAPKVSERERLENRKFGIEQKNWDNVYGNENYVLKNGKFYVPTFLQDNSDFKKHWGRIDGIVESALAGPPFNLKTTKARRNYIQKVIQGEGWNFDWNDTLYAQDFFETKFNGKNLYTGGYKKFLKDFHAVDRKMAELGMDYAEPQNAEERKLAEKWNKLKSIAFGLARVFEALRRVTRHPKQLETSNDRYRTRFVGLKKLTAKEKAKLGTLRYHNLESLLHKSEKGPKGMSIGISNKTLSEIKSTIFEQETPNLDMKSLLAAKGGLKLMFMAFGLNSLIKKGCIKKINEKQYAVVKIPTRGWGEALGTISQNKAKLHDPSKDNFKKWEEVRASLDQGRQARNFILKIFRPSGSTVKQNINWWKKLWHFDFKNKKKISMAYLGTATLNPRDLEKHVATDRGYRDMMEKTQKRVKGTSLYEPQKSEVLRLSNSYLENALLATFKNARPSNLTKVTNQLLREFNIEGKVNLKKPLDKQENRLANVKEIHKAISLKGLDSSNLTKAHIRMIQMGYVLGRQVETARNWNDVMSENLSTKPLYRAIQMKALQDGCPIYKLKELEQRIHLAVFGLSQSTHAPGAHTFNVRGGGVAAAVELGEWAGQKWHFSLGAAGADGEFIPFAEIGAAIKLGKKVKLKWSIGSTIGFTGASAAVEFPITSEWDMYMGAGAGISWKGASVGVGAVIGARWDKRRAERIKETSALSERGTKKIDALIGDGNIDQAAGLILKNPTFGKYMKAIKYKFKNPSNPKGLPNAVIVDIYQNARTEWLNAARRGVEIPAVTGFGIGVFAGVSKNIAESGVSVGAYVTFKIPGTTVNYVIRHEHPKYSEYVQSQVAQVDIKRKLLKAGGGGKNVVSSFTLKANTGIVYFDSRLGRGHVARPNGTSEMKQSIAVREKDQSVNLSNKSSFEAIKRTFANIDMHVKMVKDPKNPKNNLLAVTPLQTEGSNVEMLIDPALQSKGIVLDKANNRILLAASEARRLYVTRTKYRYPFARRGAMNLQVISFKTNPNKSNIEIRDDSPRYIYKYEGEKYAMVRGEARTGITNENSNTMTLEQYKKRKAGYETFKDRKLEYNLTEGKNLTSKMTDAVGVKEQEPTRFDELKLGDFADAVLKANLRMFERGIGNADTPAKEATFKTKFFGLLKGSFNKYSRDILGNAKLSLNEQELNLIYTYMLNQSFVKLQSKSEAVITRRLEKRNKLFRAHMKRYVGDFAKRNPEQWAQIKAIDPSVSPDSIANYLMLTMPQNAKQFREFLKREQLSIGEGLKFASYTRKYKNEAFATSYGTQMPKRFQNIFKMIGPTKLNLNSPNPRERAAAKLILQVMSPLSTKNLETVDGKKKFLESELSLLLISMYDIKSGVSPMIEVLGKKNYQGMIAIYKALKSGNLSSAINKHPQAFDQFKTLVMGVRNAQLNAEPTFVFKNKYVFHLKQTEVYSGPYLKCGNGTIAARQKIGISIREEKTAERWYGAQTKRNISVIPNERIAAKTFTVGWAHTFKRKPETGGKDRPPSDDEPGKDRPASDPNPDTSKGSPAGDTPTQTGGSEGKTPSDTDF